MIAGDLSSLAVSMTALTVLVLMTFTAGSANCFALASSKIACNSSPVATPALMPLAPAFVPGATAALICAALMVLLHSRLIETAHKLWENGHRKRVLQWKSLRRS